MNDYILGIDENGNVYLEHHGIKGQKWGVIRTPEQLGHKVNLKKPTMSRNAYDIKMTIYNKDERAPTNEDTYKLNSVKQRKLTDEELRYAVKVAAENSGFEAWVKSQDAHAKTRNFMSKHMPEILQRTVVHSLKKLWKKSADAKQEKVEAFLSDPKNWTFTDDELPQLSMEDIEYAFHDIQTIRYNDADYDRDRPKIRDRLNVGIGY